MTNLDYKLNQISSNSSKTQKADNHFSALKVKEQNSAAVLISDVSEGSRLAEIEDLKNKLGEANQKID